MNKLRTLILRWAAVGACLGCGTGIFAPHAVAGTYTLVSVDGCRLGAPSSECPLLRGPIALEGRMVLNSDGTATRAVRYRSADGTGSVVHMATGTFSVQQDQIALTLREAEATHSSRWRLSAVSEGAMLTVRYPHPADGEVVEKFRRE
jgi:hypothetical protein